MVREFAGTCWGDRRTDRADWLAWLGVLTTVGSGEGLLCGGSGLSGSSGSSRGSSLICTAGTFEGPGQDTPTDGGSGIDMEGGGDGEAVGRNGCRGRADCEEEGGAGRVWL